MKPKSIFSAALLLVGVALASAPMAHEGHEHEKHAGPAAHASTTQMSAGVVKKIDKSAGKVTIKHGPLKNLGMPAMTMVFKAKDPSLLEQIKVEDKINFVAEKINGSLTLTQLEAQK